MAKKAHKKIILGLKLKQLRTENGWNFEELHQRAGISVSYLNEIEKGRKYPQPSNLKKLADAFQIDIEELMNPRLGQHFAPIMKLLDSNFLNELPLDLFGMQLQQIVEIISKAPEQVSAFISALLEIARNYSLQEENFYKAALRAYQELHLNYFEDIEKEVDRFVNKHQISLNAPITSATLQQILEQSYQYTIEMDALDKEPALANFRSVFVPKGKKLLLSKHLNERQRTYQLAKEIGFNTLALKDRPLASILVRIQSFNEVLNNYLAAYFGVALLVNRNSFNEDLKSFFGHHTWQPEHLIRLIQKYRVSPEVLFQRFNLLALNFKLQGIVFLRIIHHVDENRLEIDKELHLNRRHRPHASGLREHYCRRWITAKLFKKLEESPESTEILADASLSTFAESGEEYLLMSIVKRAYPDKNRQVGVLIGIEMDQQLKETVKFLKDPALQRSKIGVVCETCTIENCAERMVPPTEVLKKQQRKEVLDALQRISKK